MSRLGVVVRLVGLAVCVYSGYCQNAEPKHLHDFRNSPAASDFVNQHDDFWDAAPEGSSRLQQQQQQKQREQQRRRETEEQRAGLLTPSGHGKSFDQLLLLGSAVEDENSRLKPFEALPSSRSSETRQLQSDRRRKKRRRKQQQQPQPWTSDRENLVNLGGRNRSKKRQHQQHQQTEEQQLAAASSATGSSPGKKARSRWGKLREERRRRRRNRKRARSRLRLENRREERKWRENPLGRLLKVLNEQKVDEARMLSENPLNLSNTNFEKETEVGHMRIFNPTNVSSSSHGQSQSSGDPAPRVPDPPSPTSHYRTLPSEIEREFSRHLEREFTRTQLERQDDGDTDTGDPDEDENEAEEDDEDEPEMAEGAEDQPRFDERFGGRQTTRQPFDPERMLGYSRTDEDLPILDMENEVLQRTIKDYNAYMNSRLAKNDKMERDKDFLQEHRTSTATAEPSVFPSDDDEDEPHGDLSCVNGTFLPAPFVQHAVIKYVKSSMPGHEYLEADYECESGYAMTNTSESGRLVCRGRHWHGRLPVCEFREESASCAELGCEQLCKVIGGRAECLCREGYRLEGRACLDINECDTNNGGCSEVCENTEGSYFCACEGDERILSSDRRTCEVAEKRFENLDREASLSLRFHESSDISCSPLNPAGRGYLLCSNGEPTTTTSTATATASTREKDAEDELEDVENDDEDDAEDEEEPEPGTDNNNNGEEGAEDEDEDEERAPIRPGTKCHLQCPRGYELHGEYELACRADGTWDGPKHGECLRYSKPRLDCPKDIVAELSPGRDEAFVTYDQPSTDLDWFRYVRSKPSWGTRLEANLKRGLHEITFYARHPVSKKQASCTLKINVEEGQAPKVKGCPSDIEITGKNGSAITWAEPVFTDNVKVIRVTSNEHPGQTFSVGGHKVEYEAADEAGWTTKCIFTVVLRPVHD